METRTCKTNGTHRLPPDEDSWNSERCDTLVAAGLDRCLPCQNQLIKELSTSLTDDFGKLFTTWVMTTVNRIALLGGRLPDTAVELFGPSSRAALSPPSRKALRGVRFPRQAASQPVVGFSLDTKTAVAALTGMKPDEREAVLNDAMDGIIASIALPLPPML
jgi:hypothetical protein